MLCVLCVRLVCVCVCKCVCVQQSNDIWSAKIGQELIRRPILSRVNCRNWCYLNWQFPILMVLQPAHSSKTNQHPDLLAFKDGVASGSTFLRLLNSGNKTANAIRPFKRQEALTILNRWDTLTYFIEEFGIIPSCSGHNENLVSRKHSIKVFYFRFQIWPTYFIHVVLSKYWKKETNNEW